MSILIILIIYFVLLALFSFWRGKEYQKSHSIFLKYFFPNWRFFEHLRPIPILYVRFKNSDDEYSTWQRVVPERIRNFRSLLLNPHGNYVLSLYTAIEKFAVVSMESDLADPVQSEEYKVINALILEFLKKHNVSTCKYQFKIQVETLEQKEDVILSPEIEAVFS